MTINNSQKVVVINGAYGGMGSAIAARMIKTGYSLALLGRDEKKLELLNEGLLEHNKNATCTIKKYLVNMKDISLISSVSDKIFSDFGRVDILVNAAGIVPPIGGILDINNEQWLEAIHTSLFGTIGIVKNFSNKMINQNNGKIILINGVISIQPDPLFVISSTLTGAINNFAKAVSKELGKFGVKVNVINPGITQTTLLDRVVEKISEKFKISKADISKQMIDNTPLGRMATVDDIADNVEFLCSEKSNFINGAFITIDGGASVAY